MTDTHAFLKPRYILENLWPGCPYKVYDVLIQHESTGDLWIIQSSGHLVPEVETTPKKWSYLFRELKWWEHRTVEQLLSIRYARVVKYVGYWVVDDVVPVKDVSFENGRISLSLGGHEHPAECIVPATLKEYETWQKNEKEKSRH